MLQRRTKKPPNLDLLLSLSSHESRVAKICSCCQPTKNTQRAACDVNGTHRTTSSEHGSPQLHFQPISAASLLHRVVQVLPRASSPPQARPPLSIVRFAFEPADTSGDALTRIYLDLDLVFCELSRGKRNVSIFSAGEEPKRSPWRAPWRRAKR